MEVNKLDLEDMRSCVFCICVCACVSVRARALLGDWQLSLSSCC